MIELHRKNGRQVATDPLAEIHRLIEDSERSPIEPRAFGPRSNKSPHLNWEMLVSGLLWSSVLLPFSSPATASGPDARSDEFLSLPGERHQTHKSKYETTKQKRENENARGRNKPQRGCQPTPEQIRRRAQEIFEARGSAPGSELDDWLQAETELKSGLGLRDYLREIASE
jgi:hypothetical protein